MPPPCAHRLAELERLEQLLQPLPLDRLVIREHLMRALQPDPAREALAAALVRAEAQQVPRERRACRCGRRTRGCRRGRPCSPRPRARRSRTAVSSRCAGRIPPSGPPICTALIVRPSRRPPASSSHSSRIGHPERHLVDARPREALVEADELRAGRLGVRRRARDRRPRRARATNGTLQSVSTLLTTVGMPCRPRLRGERRPRGDGPAQSLQAGEQRGLLADDVGAGALDDGHVEREVRLPRMSSPSQPSARARSAAASSAGFDSGYSERTSTKPCEAPTA